MNIHCPVAWAETHLTVCLLPCCRRSERRPTAIRSETPCSADLWDELLNMLWPATHLLTSLRRTHIAHPPAKPQLRHTTSLERREWKPADWLQVRSLTWWRFIWDLNVVYLNNFAVSLAAWKHRCIITHRINLISMEYIWAALRIAISGTLGQFIERTRSNDFTFTQSHVTPSLTEICLQIFHFLPKSFHLSLRGWHWPPLLAPISQPLECVFPILCFLMIIPWRINIIKHDYFLVGQLFYMFQCASGNVPSRRFGHLCFHPAQSSAQTTQHLHLQSAFPPAFLHFLISQINILLY